ncbi:hypothetical protein CJ030_MR4G013707 [Morella rubra]|uniref:Uncharacterized protein n=1 Tax=Morella rubra TaxID=262757 RepID=A0A6A1WS16_9ROSI|nr:hypothetical protein CJ030_MR4G013707 [Morella rubra]
MADYLTVVPKKLLQEIIIKATGSPHLESGDVKLIFNFLGPLNENQNMVWARQMTIRKFSSKWNDEWELRGQSGDGPFCVYVNLPVFAAFLKIAL